MLSAESLSAKLWGYISFTMKIFQKIRKFFQKNNRSIFFNDRMIDPENGIMVEQYFHDMLCLERKRSERSKKPFILMLINITRVDDFFDITNRICLSIFKSTRETDIKGWYKNDHILGIIFNELGDSTKLDYKNKIIDKIRAELSNNLDQKTINNIDISAYLYPEENDNQLSSRIPSIYLYPDLIKYKSSKNISLFIKLVMDILLSILALILFAPFFLLIPLLIRVTSAGPAFYKQERIGQFGRKFTMLKYRSMYINNDQSIHKTYVEKLIRGKMCSESKDGECGQEDAYKIKDDRRVTYIGKILRKTSLDELPQFFNVLKGDMSIVGPRPPIGYEVESYDVWHLRRILEMKPGITGLWQVEGRSKTTFDDMVRLDLKYAREWSLWLDIKLLAKTPWVVLAGKGGY